MKKDYKKPLITSIELEVNESFAVIGTSDGAADWNNIDFDSWDNLFN